MYFFLSIIPVHLLQTLLFNVIRPIHTKGRLQYFPFFLSINRIIYCMTNPNRYGLSAEPYWYFPNVPSNCHIQYVMLYWSGSLLIVLLIHYIIYSLSGTFFGGSDCIILIDI